MALINIEKDTKYPMDLVVIHGSGMEVNSQGRIVPPFDSMLRIIAGVKAYELGWTKHLLFSGGYTFGHPFPSEAEVGIDFLSSAHPFWGGRPPKIKVSEETIILEDNSKSTRDNIASLVENLESADQLRLGFCTNNYHMPYVKALARNYDLHPIEVSAETLAQMRNPRLSEAIKERYASSEMRKIERTQRLLRLELLFDPTAKLPALMANLLRK